MSRLKKTALSCAVIILLLFSTFPIAYADTVSVSASEIMNNANLNGSTQRLADGSLLAMLYSGDADFEFYIDNSNFYTIANEEVTITFDYNSSNFVYDKYQNYQSTYIYSVIFKGYTEEDTFRTVEADLISSSLIDPQQTSGTMELVFRSPYTITRVTSVTFCFLFNGGNYGCHWDSSAGQLVFGITSDFKWTVGSDPLQEEKDEASSSGNSAADQLGSAIPDKSQGFISALQNFVGSMSTTATDCVFTIPQLKLPAVAGIIPETVLWEEQHFDMGAMVEILPGAILTLLRALFDIALIVFCFKELYSIIEYVLTMRKGGGS